MNIKRIIVGVLSIVLGLLFIYGGTKKFRPSTKKKTDLSEVSAEEKERIGKIRAFIGGMKKTGYMWEFLGVCEIIFGIMLISQYFTLLGAVMLLPITLNILLFHIFLEPHDIGELIITSIYTTINFVIIFFYYDRLKKAFLTKSLSLNGS